MRPVRMLTTPPGRSEVASTSDSVTAGSGRGSRASTTTVLPLTIAGATTRDEPEQRSGPAGASTADDTGRLGQREVEVRARRPGWHAPRDLGDLVRPAGVPDPAVDGRVHEGSAARAPSPRPRGSRRRTAPGGPPASRRPGRGPGPGCTRSRRPSPASALRAATPRRARPCARPARRWRGSRPRGRSPGRTFRSPNAGTPRRCRACTSCARRPGRRLRQTSRYASSPCRPPSRP